MRLLNSTYLAQMASSQYFKMVAMFPILELAWPLFVGSSYSAIDTALNPVPTTVRRIAQGRFNPTEGRCCILGASHGPVVFRLGIPFVPSLEEMQAGLSRIDACPPRFLETFWAGVACAGSAIFVSAPTQAVHRTVVVKERSSKRRNNQGVSEKGIKQEWVYTSLDDMDSICMILCIIGSRGSENLLL